jgi:glycerophosphoryl diester phosphodiesterase
MKFLSKFIFPWFLLGFSWVWLCGFTVVGHRGDPAVAPEETFASFDAGFAAGAKYCELDIRESSDGVLVISHDATLTRVTGENLKISKTPFAQLQQARQANGEPIHSLAELFQHYQNRPNTRFLIETKKKKKKPVDMEPKLTALVKQYQMSKRVMFHSFSAYSVTTLAQELPKVPRYLLGKDLDDITLADLQAVTGVSLPEDQITPTFIKQLHDWHKQVFVWSEMDENAKLIAQLTADNIDGLITNYPNIGATYAKAAAHTRYQTVDLTAVTNRLTKTKTWENPYLGTHQTKRLAANQTEKVTAILHRPSGNRLRLADGRWVDAADVNVGTAAVLAAPYIGQTATLRATTTLWAGPGQAAQSQPITWLPQRQVTITGCKVLHDKLWFQLDQTGWAPAERVLLHPFKATQYDLSGQLYWQLPAHARLTNIALPTAWSQPVQTALNAVQQTQQLAAIKLTLTPQQALALTSATLKNS